MIVIHGQTPSHKNSRNVVRNRATGRPFLRNTDQFLSWAQGAEVEVLSQARRKFRGELRIVIRFFVKNKVGRDLDNMAASVLDVLSPPGKGKKYGAGVIDDDSCFVVPDVHLIFGGIDREDPRAEIDIYELDNKQR